MVYSRGKLEKRRVDEILAAVRRPRKGSTLSSPDFSGATFLEKVNFKEVTFEGRARFSHASFLAGAAFDFSKFTEQADFEFAEFDGEAGFLGTDFDGGVTFRFADFNQGAYFMVGQLAMADFVRSEFRQGANFNTAMFDGAMFSGATFHGDVTFRDAEFAYGVDLSGAVFDSEVEFPSFVTLGPVGLGATFAKRLDLEFSADYIDAKGLRLADGGNLRIRSARYVDLTDSDFPKKTMIAGVSDSHELARAEAKLLAQASSHQEQRTDRPVITSLMRSTMTGLALSSVDLGVCLFSGAHDLDKVRLEGNVTFGRVPRGRRFSWRTDRHVIAEERIWRSNRANWAKRGWAEPRKWRDEVEATTDSSFARALKDESTEDTPVPTTATSVDDSGRENRDLQSADVVPPTENRTGSSASRSDQAVRARQVAGTYRQLRKSFEDNKNEPGAADFYYGEMEMRRRGARSASERAILFAYWFVSGYGLRAWRAFGSLLVLLALGSILFATVGMSYNREAQLVPLQPSVSAAPGSVTYRQTSVPTTRPGFGAAISLAVQSATGFLRPSQSGYQLTPIGQAIEVSLRLLGPALLGLAILSLRGRAKR